MKKILLLPLDERPCNYRYPGMMPRADYKLLLPPREYMGDKKTPAKTDLLAQWLLDNVKGADACILSLDMLIYGGILPSRLHYETEQTLLERAAVVEQLRKRNPKMKLYVFQLIMRCPVYSSDDEEPDYYEDCGKEIHLFGRYTHLQKLGKLSEADEKDFRRVKSVIPADALRDYTARRDKNIAVLLRDLELINRGIVDYFIIPQDDAAEFGFTAMDQIRVREYLREHSLHMKTAMYPSADDVGLTLLARAVNELSGVTPKIYVHYASSKGAAVIPLCEDRPVDETIKYQILSAGCRRVYSLPEADILLAVNIGSKMNWGNDPSREMALGVERTLSEFVSFIEYALAEKKLVAVGDVAVCNGSDEELLRLMNREGLLLNVHAYAGWNTSSNTLGTAICQVCLYSIGRDETGNRAFLLHRYYEDAGYMSYARQAVTDGVLPSLGLDYFHADGENGKAAEAVKREIDAHMRETYPEIAAQVQSFSVRMPWRRMFETDLEIRMKS